MKYRILKEQIKSHLNNGEIEEVERLIVKYNEELRYDCDFQNIKAIYHYMKNELEQAESILLRAHMQIDYSFDITFNLGMVYEAKGELVKAFKYYNEARGLDATGEEKALCNSRIKYLVDEVINRGREHELLEYKAIMQEFHPEEGREYSDFPYAGKYSKIGEYEGQHFIGLYDNTFVERDNISLPTEHSTLIKLEMYNISEEQEEPMEGLCMVPILALKDDTQIVICKNNKESKFKINRSNRYYYYKLEQGDFIKKNKDIVYGKPIPLKKKAMLKDLVLVVFVDGLSHKVLEEYGDSKLMPNTAKFFKEGIVCNNTYVSGEWTYVSLASFFTGNYTVNHNMFHPDRNAKLSIENPILSEGFQKKGYMTAKIDGDWRSNVAYGYGRGFDRVVYQPSVRGMDTPDVLKEVIEHMEAFKETNQFIWTCLPDLHDIADGYHLPISVQVHEELEEKVASETYEKGLTSVRQEYSLTKKNLYLKQVSRIDTYLGMLYQYIESNFDMDKVVVALVSDHGQGYLVEEGQHFMSEGRVKVPMMIRGGSQRGVRSDELVQGLDLMSILYNICEISEETQHLDTNLPKCFGGNQERPYTYSEMLFPGSTYKVSIYMKDYVGYFESKEEVRDDGRVKLEPYTVYIESKGNGKRIEDEQLEQNVVDIIYEHMKYRRIYE